MNKRTLIPILWVMALASIIYAIYRSTEHQIVLTGETQQTIYGAPQHGLLLGLLIFAGLCVAASIPLLLDRNNPMERRSDLDRRRETIREDDTVITRRKL